jgi:hypothetical protein
MAVRFFGGWEFEPADAQITGRWSVEQPTFMYYQ